MRVIKSDSGFLAYQKIFRHIISGHSPVVIWQVLASGERRVSESFLNSFHLDTALMHFEKPQNDEIYSDLPLYLYSEEGQFIFKTHIQDLRSSALSVAFPPEIKLLEEPDVTFIRGQIGLDMAETWRTKRLLDVPDHADEGEGIMKVKAMSERSTRDQDFLNQEFAARTLDEEEKLFADKRESPRARPKIDKWVKVQVGTNEEVHLVRLFDLSRGGIGFVTLESHQFPKGSIIRVVGFDEFDLDDPILGKIMSQRAIDDTQIEFKIGVKFDEGQE